MDLETQGVGGSQALLTVLQDGVSGGQEHPESLHRAGYPSVRAPPPVPHWLSMMGEQSARTPPEFVPSLFMGWPLPYILFPPFLHTYFCSYILNSPIG